LMGVSPMDRWGVWGGSQARCDGQPQPEGAATSFPLEILEKPTF
jgi:hypothetical protein